MKPRKEFMVAAIQEALNTKNSGDYAIGAVVCRGDEIIARAGNRIKLDNDPTHHAEIVAIRQAAKFLGSHHLRDCILYTTHEPCPMCTSAAIWARMRGIVSGAKMEDIADYGAKNGTRKFDWRIIDIPASLVMEKGVPKLFHVGEFMREECVKLFHK